MALVQSVDSALAENVGSHGVDAHEFGGALARAEPALADIRQRHADASLPLLRLPATRDDLAIITQAARAITAGARDIVFLGTGGSSLGGQTLAQISGHGVAGLGMLRDGARLHFMDNLDPDTFAAILQRLPLATTRFVAISKSGGTAETLMQTIAALSALKAAPPGAPAVARMLGITEPARSGTRNGLRDLLAAHDVPVLDHDPRVGGRFSVLANVGLLPAAIAGLDIAAVRAGAARALAPILAGKPAAEVPAAIGAALAVAAAETRAKSVAVTMAYSDRLERFTRWYVQLWAESLGKDGRGTTPIAALGPVDQHSQLQLFIAGPRDKLFTVITTGTAGRGPRVDAELAACAGAPALGGKHIGDLVAAQGRATTDTLARNGCPVRTLHIDRVDEASVGELLMHFMLETVIAARLLGVDAFDQPAVEEGKLLAKAYLTAG
ncbi:MAG: glucose-6-phosphate isomerase [Proteobacteria bacterium]|nr:glucose-6-phosphate isomerase [Pseudomonadota bacterium]